MGGLADNRGRRDDTGDTDEGQNREGKQVGAEVRMCGRLLYQHRGRRRRAKANRGGIANAKTASTHQE